MSQRASASHCEQHQVITFHFPVPGLVPQVRRKICSGNIGSFAMQSMIGLLGCTNGITVIDPPVRSESISQLAHMPWARALNTCSGMVHPTTNCVSSQDHQHNDNVHVFKSIEFGMDCAIFPA